jgi:hypothetical protein
MVFNNNLLLGAGGQSTGPAPFDPTLIGNSVWFDGSADYMDKTFSSGSAQSRIVYACWLQRNDFSRLQSIFTADKSGRADRFGFQADDTIDIHLEQNGGSTIIYSTSQVFRDTGWYHFILSIDLNVAQASAVQLYVNGVQNDVTVTFGPSAGALSTMDSFGNAARHAIGKRSAASDRFSNTYQTQCTLLVGQSIQNGDVAVTDILDAFTFGTNGSQFTPKSDAAIAALASTAGGNSFCLDFADSADLGNDISSNANDFTPNSMSSANQSINTPSKYYPKVSNIGIPSGDTAANYTMDRGSNRMVYSGADQGYKGLISTQLIQPDDSPIYWEYYLESGSVGGASGGRVSVGLCVPNFNVGIGAFSGAGGNNPSNLRGEIYDNGSQGATTGSTLIGVGDIQNLAYEPSTGKIWFGVNGTWNNGSEAASTTLNPSGHDYQATVQDYVFFISAARSTDIGVLNFGDNPSMSGNITAGTETDANGHGLFKYAVPSGFFAPVSANLTAPDYQGIDYFDATLYQGNGTGQRVGDFVPFTDAYNVDNSAMFDSADLRYLARTPSSGGNEKTFTFSTWIKITGVGNNLENAVLTTDDGSKEAQIRISGTTLATKKVTANLYNGSSFILNISTDRTFGDTSSWNHLVVAYDTRAAVASADKVIIYINGVRQSVSGTLLTVDDYETEFNSTNEHNIGRQSNNGIGEADFYLAETVMIDGQQLDASSFGQLDTSTNRWIPKDVSSLTFGTNGFYLEYKSTFGTGSGAGTDTSGNSNNWTESTDGGSAWATTDQFTDTPSKNYPIFSRKNIGSATATLTEGNLKYTGADNGGFPITMQPTSGKWYFEVELDTAGNYYPGLFTAAGLSYTSTSAWAQTSSFVYLTSNANGAVYNGSTVVNGYNTGALSSGDRLAIAWDVDNRLIYYGLASGGSTTFFSSGDPVAGTGAAPFDLPNERLYFGVVSGGSSDVSTHHFISSGWEGAAPTGFSELNQDNLDDTASKITAWAWIKNRDAADDHILVDRVRGVGEVIHSNSTAAETTEPNTVQRFLQRGVQVGSDVQVNTANESYVLWQWLVGDSATTGSTNNSGSIASTVIAADADHFSIGTYTGTGAVGTVGHGLTGAPDMIMIKNRGAAESWPVYHNGIASNAETYALFLNNTSVASASAVYWNNTAPTSSVFTVGTDNSVNASSGNLIFFAFRSVPGVCKVGSYVGNGNADGPFVSLNFNPKLFLLKRTDVANDWLLGYLPSGSNSGEYMFANSNATGGTLSLDMLSTSIKIRTSGTTYNASGGNYVFLAMADIGGNGTLPPIYGR